MWRWMMPLRTASCCCIGTTVASCFTCTHNHTCQQCPSPAVVRMSGMNRAVTQYMTEISRVSAVILLRQEWHLYQ